MSDLISREEAIAQVDKEFLPGVDVPICKEIRTAIKRILYNVPSADRESGEWIMHISDIFPADSTQECSNCHAHTTILIENDNFCPNCGAKMGGNK